MKAALAVALVAASLPAQGQVFVVGEAAVTSVPCSEEMTLSRVLAAAQPKATAALEYVALLRMDDRGCGIAVVDAAGIMRGDGSAWDAVVKGGDVVYLPKRPGPRDRPWTTVAVRRAALAPMLTSGVADPRRAWLQTQLLMHTTDRAVRQQMALDLAHGPDPALAVQQLVSVLDLDPSIAREAVTALGTMGGAARSALPELERLCDHVNQPLRECVRVALQQIRVEPARVTPALAGPPAALAQGAAELRAKFDAYLQPLVGMRMFAGSVLVARKAEILLQQGYGPADIAAGTVNDAATRFKLMSTSKSITAVAMLRLVQQGLVSLDDPVGKHLAPWPEAWRDVTVHDLLDHTSGIPDLENEWANAQEQAKARGLAAWPSFGKGLTQSLQGKPGSRHRYSNFNFELVGLVLEAAGGKPFRELLRSEVLAPAGMSQTGFDDGSRFAGLALGYCRGRLGVPDPSQQDMSRIQAAGGCWSTVGDLYRFDRALRDDTLLGAATRAAMFAPRQGTYACGWDTQAVHGHRCLQHSGGANGYVADFLRFPDDDACVVVLSNFAFAPILRISHDLAAILFGVARPLPVAVDAAELDACAGVYAAENGDHSLLVRRSGDALFGFDVWPGEERVGGRLLVPIGARRFLPGMGEGVLEFALERAITPSGRLPRCADLLPRWRAAAGRYRADPAIGDAVQIVEAGGRLLLRITGGWPAEAELAPVSANSAIALVSDEFGTLLQLSGATFRWTRADGLVVRGERLP